ncbi:light-independent protochlorophyllide reductase subunit B-like [Cryptomeria japonica]|uniref:light-independent protochlorophyllide reductase subunit B-like n=1 Tax=Cryptomeria japonica TaxID=3369 RepID=UPI0027D9D784|nr:light-independent protochlorophyllide reductase subunit B-like [Cryptomeria japonica]
MRDYSDAIENVRNIMATIVPCKLSQKISSELEHNISLDKICIAICHMKKSKVPKCDGFPIEFYKANTNLVHKILPEVYKEAIENGYLGKHINRRIIKLIILSINGQTQFVSQAAWFSRSIDCQNLTGKETVVFGDTTHAASITKILVREMGIRVSCACTYCKHDAEWFKEQIQGFCDEILITDDHAEVGDMIAHMEPSAIFGTQMECHIGKRLDIPCGVISAPVHIQNFPLGYRPFLGYEGTNQIADLVYNSFALGMEDHLLDIFGGHDTKEIISTSLSTDIGLIWNPESRLELSKIPRFAREKVERNTEKFARQKGIETITVEVMYAAKEALNT